MNKKYSWTREKGHSINILQTFPVIELPPQDILER